MANSEGYTDRTAEQAINRASKTSKKNVPDAISFMVDTFKRTADVLGFEIEGRIVFRDKKSGKVWY